MRGEQEFFLAEFLGDHARDLWLNLCAWSLNSLSAARREGMSQMAHLWAQKRASSENKAWPRSYVHEEGRSPVGSRPGE